MIAADVLLGPVCRSGKVVYRGRSAGGIFQ